MKQFIASPFLVLALAGSAQTTTVTYDPATVPVANPERGMYHQAETHSAAYAPLDPGVLANWYAVDHHRLILRLFYLEDFVNAPISATYLTQMQDDMDAVRTSGMKAVLRFAYTANTTPPYGDADKAHILQHIAQLEPFLRANADVIAFVQAGFIGTWGEWYYTDHFGLPPDAGQIQDRKDVLEALLDALPEGIMVQLRTPAYKMQFYGNSPLDPNDAFTAGYAARTGHHNDCFLASATDIGTYQDTTVEYPYLHAETEFTPMGGETCALNPPRSECPTALDEMELFHWSYLHADWNPDVIAGFVSGGCMDEITDRLGYRFVLQSGTYPDMALAGGTMDISIDVANEGFAVPYKYRSPKLVLRDVATDAITLLDLPWEIREWDAGVVQHETATVSLPTGMALGEHQLYLYFPDSSASIADDPRYAIQLANAGTWDGTTGYNDLMHMVDITGTVGIGETGASSKTRAAVDHAGGRILVQGDAGTYALWNIQGQQLWQGRVGNGTTAVPMADRSPGVYLLRRTTGTGSPEVLRVAW